MLNRVRRHAMEAEAAVKLERIMRREFGLSPTGTTADLCGSVLRVTLKNAISPLGQMIAQEQEGKTALEKVYAILHQVNRDKMHSLVSRALGVPVRRSSVEADLMTLNVSVTFHLAGPLL